MKYIFATILASILFFQSHAQENPKLTAAEKEFQEKNYQKALGLYTELIDSKEISDCSYIHFKRGFCYYCLFNYKAAKVDYEIALKVSPDNKDYKYIKGSTYWMYGRLYSKTKHSHKCVKMLLQAKAYNQSSALYSTLGYQEGKIKKYEEALAHLAIAIALDKTNAYAYNNRAYIYLKLNDLESARDDINTSISLNTENSYVYKHSALIYIQLKQYDLACTDLQKAKELGYANFGDEEDKDEVNKLLKKYCK